VLIPPVLPSWWHSGEGGRFAGKENDGVSMKKKTSTNKKRRKASSVQAGSPTKNRAAKVKGNRSANATKQAHQAQPSREMPLDGRQRVMISGIAPVVDDGRFPIKRVVGDSVDIEADVFVDGHDVLRGLLLYRREGEQQWQESPLEFIVNDRWQASFVVEEMGFYEYTIRAWIDPFRTWLRDMHRRIEADKLDRVDFLIGAKMLASAASNTTGDDSERLRTWAKAFEELPLPEAAELIESEFDLVELMDRHSPHQSEVTYDRTFRVRVDRVRAHYSAWYELFPRSVGPASKHGTFLDCIEMLPYIQSMGFDVLYLPPIHPIGHVNRKGKNNALKAEPDDVGSPWAIGSAEGGHKSIHPELGSLEDFHLLVDKAKEHGMEVALDIALQCAPDHPYVKEHPEWFQSRPDGTIQYAENPPKKYEDIYPFDFGTEAWQSLWEELASIFEYWVEQGVRIFRVDNPHTKAFSFWEWLIARIQATHPDVIFLAEAFTRPKVMQRLAKLGFSQSYTYFSWRNTRWELRKYLEELTQTEVREFMRPNFWPNTPDILTEYLQMGGRPAFMIRLLLAATMTSSYGIYGPAYELSEGRPREFGSEEYLDSEKYQIREWDLENKYSLRKFIARVNRIRRENPALQNNHSLRFHDTDNEQVICYSKTSSDKKNIVLTVVGLDPYHRHSAWVDVPIDRLGFEPHEPYQVHDLLTGARYVWYGNRNYVELDPHSGPGHILKIRRRLRTERDFDYFM
jgi:starch synthase (maltosyl-transferring)